MPRSISPPAPWSTTPWLTPTCCCSARWRSTRTGVSTKLLISPRSSPNIALSLSVSRRLVRKTICQADILSGWPAVLARFVRSMPARLGPVVRTDSCQSKWSDQRYPIQPDPSNILGVSMFHTALNPSILSLIPDQ